MEEQDRLLHFIQSRRSQAEEPRAKVLAILRQKKLIDLIRHAAEDIDDEEDSNDDHGRDNEEDKDYDEDDSDNDEDSDVYVTRKNWCPETSERVAAIADLLHSGVDPFAADYNMCMHKTGRKMTVPLHMAVSQGMHKVAELLLRHAGYPNVADQSGITAAHLAADCGSAKCLKVLIEFGADINAPTKKDLTWKSRDCPDMSSTSFISCKRNSTPLHVAAQENSLECVKLLLAHGADINALNSKQQSPLYWAAKEGHAECMRMLIHNPGNPPDIVTPTRSQTTVLAKCFCHGKKMRNCITELVDSGADVCHPNLSGFTPMHEAVYNRYDLDTMKLLVWEGRGMDLDRALSKSPLVRPSSPLVHLMDAQMHVYRRSRVKLFKYTNRDESTALLFLRLGASRRDLKAVLWGELNLPKPHGVLLETLMDSFAYLPSLSELEAERESRPVFSKYTTPDNHRYTEWVCSGTLWHRLKAGTTEEARAQEEEKLKAIVAEKKKNYHQRRKEVPSLQHLSRSAIRSNVQANVREVVYWPLPPNLKRYVLLGHPL